MPELDNLSFYDQHPDIYHVLTGHRDMRREINRYRLDPCQAGRTVELFAGPAYHSCELARRNWSGELWAIDASARMKELAISRGFPDGERYLVGDVVERMQAMTDATCVLIPRMSLGLIHPEQASQLVKSVADSLVPGGSAYIELYRIDSLMTRLRQATATPRQIMQGRREFIYCSPARAPRWDQHAWHVWIPASITIREGTQQRVLEFESEEWLYTVSDVRSWLACDRFASMSVELVGANQVSSIFRLWSSSRQE